MRYLVTGGAGFIGSHLVDHLVGHSHSVSVLDDFSTGSAENIKHPPDVVHVECGDVANLGHVGHFPYDGVFHLASPVGVRLVLKDPAKTVDSILGGTRAVLSACVRQRIPLLFASTSEVYGTSKAVPFPEDDPCQIPSDPVRWGYAAAKFASEQQVLAWHRKTLLPAVVVRIFNTVGPRQSGDYGMVLPSFVDAVQRGKAIEIYGDGEQTRCFAHVKDVAGALARLLETPAAHGQIVNVGGDEEVSIRQLAERVMAAADKPTTLATVPYERAYGVGFEDCQRRVPDLTKLRRLIGYEPERTLDDAIRDTLNWKDG